MKFLKEFAIPAAVLTLLCLVVSGALVLTYNTTQPIIEAAKVAESNKARSEVLSGGDKFEQVSVTTADVVEAYKASNGAGYVITTKTKGYGGDFNVVAGIKSDGSIDKVKMMNANETPGLGSRVGEEAYTSKYSGKTGNDVDSVEAISGATVSSYAFRHGVKVAFEAYGELAGVTFEEPKSPEQVLFPDVEAFEDVTVEGAVKALKAGDKGVVIVTEAQGYSGAATKMQVYTAIGPDGKIVGVRMGDNSETPGIGSQVNDDAYTSQYVGKENADGITAVSGATESSEGFQAAVKQAMELYAASALKGA
ncbi:MAG: FMN-binding protein [Angelakisella sp.]